MGDFRKLKVWHHAHELTLAVYSVTASFPPIERFGLTAQLRRSAASIPANIAEGCGRNSDAELARYCQIGLGSANELQYHLLLASELGYLEQQAHSQLADATAGLRGMLHRLSNACRRSGKIGEAPIYYEGAVSPSGTEVGYDLPQSGQN